MTHILSTGNRQSMTSLQIAELVQSRHSDVKRTIERLALNDAIQLPPLAKVKNHQALSNNNISKAYIFSGEQGKLDSITVVAQLCPMFTARLVKRWQELESLVSGSEYQALIIQNQALKSELLKSNQDYKTLQVMHDGGLENWQMSLVVGLATSTVSKKLAYMRKLGLIGERGTSTALITPITSNQQLALEV